ncbi:MAG: S9 family peptidase [Anaerolineales bacterium]|nr:S9 family peptidase [Anaerolineales bacterium]
MIAYRSKKAGGAQLYVMPAERPRILHGSGSGVEGRYRPLTKIPGGVGGGPVWSPNGKWIAFTAPPEQELTGTKRITRPVFQFDRLGDLPAEAQEIYIVPSEGGDPVRLTDDEGVNTVLGWSPESRRLLYLSTLAPDDDPLDTNLKIVDLDGRSYRLYSNWGRILGGAWLRDGERLLWVGSPASRQLGCKNDLWLGSVHEIPPRCLTEDLEFGVGGLITYDMPVSWERDPVKFLLSPDGRSAYVTVQKGGRLPIYRIALNGKPSCELLIDAPRTCILESLVDHYLLYSSSTLHSPSDLGLLELDLGRETQLTDLNGEWRSSRLLPSTKKFSVRRPDGNTVESWLLIPPDGNPPYPTVLNIHGGPHEAYGERFVFDFQLLAGAGYAVLFANPRGSTGYGDLFSTEIHGNWGGQDYEDLMAVVDEAVALGAADPDRLGVYGLSYGGYMSCWIVGHTNRFKAAVAENPLTDWTSFYGTSDIGPPFAEAQLGGKPHEIPETYWERSPVAYAHRCKTPVLLLVSDEDRRCPPGQSEQFYIGLHAAGCKVEMVRFPGAAHTASWDGPLMVRQAQNEALLGWMDAHLKE